ncbi:DUF3007 family protein [Candidatus Synechococcus calcipolaris G9]|uniref:DUF3007 family protein n=1 Tax=Candidatus Synechococcus calcipolaris G9 TaxID=1497997 RepID=A0ABT6F073_9SYNE|nr:DUF3007 family protein [Candidatus Synechococcus calcipolaris]MDG2991263.1 DUF3007 family protein [Candidatus Synechococcus calcipolaris G9]
MRRVDVIFLGFGVFIAGGLIYALLRLLGVEETAAGIWSQGIFIVGVMVWVLSYFGRVFTGKMTYNQQLTDYEDAVLEKKLAEMTPEELEQLAAELNADPEENSP